jgi:hypothetical protein
MSATALDLVAIKTDVTNYAPSFRVLVGLGATALGSPLQIYQTNAAGTAVEWVTLSSIPTAITVAVEAVDTSCSVLFATEPTGDLGPKTNAGLTYNAATNALTATTFIGALTGNAATVTTNANLTGPVTSVGNATAIANGAISNAMIANGAVANLSGTNTGDQTNITGNAATVTTNANLTGGVTSVGNSATVVTNANLTGDVTSSGNVTTLTNAPVIAKVLTGYTSGAGTVAATDSILQAIQKLNGNDATNANMSGAVTSSGSNVTALGTFTKALLDAAVSDGNVAYQSDLTSYPTTAAIAAAYQPLDGDLTSIAALTTTAFGRSLLTQADASATRTTIGAGTSSFDGVYSSLTSIPSTFTPSTHAHSGADITSGTVPPAQLGSGASITTKYLRGDSTWQELASGSGDALVSGTLDQFADVTQTGGATLAISASTTLSGGTHSNTNTGDQTIALTGAVTGTGTGSFATSLGSFTKAQLDAAVSDDNVAYVGTANTFSQDQTISKANPSLSLLASTNTSPSVLFINSAKIVSWNLNSAGEFFVTDVSTGPSRLFVGSTGNIGIGDYYAPSNLPQANLSVAGAATIGFATSASVTVPSNGLAVNGGITASGTLALGPTSGAAPTISSNNLQTNNIVVNGGAGNIALHVSGSAGVVVCGSGRLGLGDSHYVSWHQNGDGTGGGDIRLSRNAANVLQIGTTANNALGSLLLTNLTASGTVTATTVNKVTLTTPATGSTLTIADGATLTVSASATVSSGTHSNTNTGDNATNTQYSGLVTNANHSGDATGATVLTIAAGVVTLAKMADMATSSLIYRKTASTGAPEVNTLATLKTDLGLTGTNSGDNTVCTSGTATTAATLLTTRAIYGNNFDGSAALTQIIASTFGGTGNGFTKFSGPTTAERTKTLRDAADTILELGGSYTPTGTWTNLQLANVTLGTPATGTLTSCTGLPVSTGISGLGTGVATALGLAITAAASTVLDDTTVSAMVDTLGGASATGTGGLVRGTSPTIATPVINGLPTGTGVATANTASTLVARDASGNFTAGTITAALTGTASGNMPLAGGTFTSGVKHTLGTYTPTGITQIIDLNAGNITKLSLASALGNVTLTLTVPTSGTMQGTILVLNGSTARNLIIDASDLSTIKFLCTKIDTSTDTASTRRAYTWMWDGTNFNVLQSEMSTT